MAIIKCKMCGGELEIQEGQSVGICEYCGTKQTLPKLTSDKKANMYDRASHFRRNNDYDKAMGIYEQILNEDNTDAEAYWSLVLCRYGIEYVEDPATHKRVPTVNRAQYTSIFADEDYKSALANADAEQKAVYEAEAKAIDEIQKGILKISRKEEPFDVFICYKETDVNGRRTPDSVLANDLYHQLNQEGFKVFFAKITLEDKLGQEYEPYIFAALNSAKVMVVLGTKPEHFNAVWVKNEWSRYLALIRNGAKKVLIPAYRDMDPYDLPEEFSHLQAQDMSKLGFMQDLIRGIKKITVTEETKPVQETVVVQQMGQAHDEVAPLLRRAELYLEDGDWSSVDEYCERVLDMEPENSNAYLYKLMVELKCHREEELKRQSEPFDGNNYYQKALRFADDELKMKLRGMIQYINERNEKERQTGIYNQALDKIREAESKTTHNETAYKAAAELFESIPEFQDARQKAQECLKQAEIEHKERLYFSAKSYQERNTIWGFERAIEEFSEIADWKDAAQQIETSKLRLQELREEEEQARLAKEREEARKNRRNLILAGVTSLVAVLVIALTMLYVNVIDPSMEYKKADALLHEGKSSEAIAAFENLGDYKDSAERVQEIRYAEAEALLDAGKTSEAMIVFENLGDYKDAQERCRALWQENSYIAYWNTIGTAGSVDTASVVAICNDHTVTAANASPSVTSDLADWSNIAAISVGDYDYVLGLQADGTVVAAGGNANGRCNVVDWQNIIAISAGAEHCVGLMADGTVLATGKNIHKQCDVEEWNNIIAVSAGTSHTVGLHTDGTVVATGDNTHNCCDVENWNEITEISCGEYFTVGLRKDGTVITTYSSKYGVDWTNIIDISAGDGHFVGLREDGTVVAKGNNTYGQCNVENWTDIVAVNAGGNCTIGLRSDGTLLVAGLRREIAKQVESWTDIQIPQRNEE